MDDVWEALDDWELTDQITEVVSGTARGADLAGETWAIMDDVPIKRFPADWDTYGKRAGYLRNEQMAEYADALVAVWDGVSRGTNHMIEAAKVAGLKVSIWYFEPKITKMFQVHIPGDETHVGLTAAVNVVNGVVSSTAPILGWAKGKKFSSLQAWVQYKHGELTEVR